MSERVTEPLGGESELTRSIAGAPHPLHTTHVPSRIGRYTIVRILGEGGMGTVYEAQQESPKRSVALKVIRAGHVSPGLLRRFEHESAVLGRLQHPGIAQVYEAGTVQDERGHSVPFFAMEFIRGVPLTEYASAKHLGTRERLDLIARICDAVYHAHQKGVIHRDLKPGNILVDQSGQPKVLDFGVARAIDSDIQYTTLQTDIGQLIGTVPYMSPEQVGGHPSELDTRSDVYALGVIAYELLAGRMPYDLRRRAIHEAARIIKEEEPTRLSSINRTLRGDVETIVAKALEKDKSRRYQSAESLASDIRRYLKDEPITARPASTWYQARKFSRRNKGLVAGLAAAFALLALGIFGTSFALKRALRAESDLKVQLAETDKARKAEKDRADETKKVSDFQQAMLAQVDPTTAGVELTEDVNRRFAAALEKANVPEAERAGLADEFRKEWARVNATDAALALIDATILKPAVKAIDEQFKDQPVVDAQLRQALADRYRNLGLYDQAFPLQKVALETRRRVLGEEQLDTLGSINNMGVLLEDQGKFAEAESYYREAMDKSRRVLGEEDTVTLTSINNMGGVFQNQGKYAEAEPYVREALQKRRRVLGEEHPQTLNSISNMGALLKNQGKLAEAEPYYREALETSRRVLGQEHPDTLTAIDNLGSLLKDQGKLAEAEPYYREALEKSRRVLGEDHPHTLGYINGMGYLLQAQGKLAEAEPYWRDRLEKSRRVLGEDHPDTLTAINNLGGLLQAQRKLDEAEPYLREALEKRRRLLGQEHPDTLSSINNLGGLLQNQGKYAEAEGYYREAMEKYRRLLGEEHPSTLTVVNNMGGILQDQGKLAEAEGYYREVLETRRRVLGEEHPDILISLIAMGGLLRQQGQHQEAIDLLTPIEPAVRSAFTGGYARRLADLLTALGRARVGLGYDSKRFNAAEANLLEAHPIYIATRGEKHKATLGCVQGLVDLYSAWDEAEPGKGFEDKAAQWNAKLVNKPDASERK